MIESGRQRNLIQKAKNGNEQAFEDLVSTCQGKAYSIAFRYMKNESDTLDVLQEAFIKMYVNLGSFSFKSSFETWFFRIVINCCYDALRKLKSEDAKAEAAGKSEADCGPNAEYSSPESILIAAEQSRIVLDSLDFLPPQQKDVLILREYNHCSYGEIAEILQISEGTVKSRLNRAKLHLRDILTEQNPNFFV